MRPSGADRSSTGGQAQAIPAIETRYAGCRFRSRLEARWAVFFDALHISWQYEPQGILASYRLSRYDGTFPYLPDFWLPGLGLWVEVKGSLTDAECLRLLDAAAHLSANGGGGCHDSGGNDLVVLGPVPRPEIGDGYFERRRPIAPLPWRLHMHKGDLVATGWDPTGDETFGGSCSAGEDYQFHIATDFGGSLGDCTSGCDFEPKDLPRILVATSGRFGGVRVADAYTSARSARFEHGESALGVWGRGRP